MKAVAADLETSGFRVVRLVEVVASQPWQLHVKRVKAHFPASLNARNSGFYSLVKKYSLKSHDAMDVGPFQRVQGNSELKSILRRRAQTSILCSAQPQQPVQYFPQRRHRHINLCL